MITDLTGYFSGKELNDLGVDITTPLSEDELLALLARRVSQIMQQSLEAFFQIMYRMDIPEAALSQAMNSDNPDMTIAEVILTRQKMKLKSRMEHTTPRKEDDDDLRW